MISKRFIKILKPDILKNISYYAFNLMFGSKKLTWYSKRELNLNVEKYNYNPGHNILKLYRVLVET